MNSIIFTTFAVLFCLLGTKIYVSAFDDIEVGQINGVRRASLVTVVSGHWVLNNSQSKHPIGSYHKW